MGKYDDLFADFESKYGTLDDGEQELNMSSTRVELNRESESLGVREDYDSLFKSFEDKYGSLDVPQELPYQDNNKPVEMPKSELMPETVYAEPTSTDVAFTEQNKELGSEPAKLETTETRELFPGNLKQEYPSSSSGKLLPKKPIGAGGEWTEYKPAGDRTLKENVSDKLKNFAKGGLSTVEGLGGALKAVGIDEQGEKLNQVARDIEDKYLQTVSEPTFADKVAAGFGSGATFFIPGTGIATGLKAVSAAPKLAKIASVLGLGYAAVSESAVEAGGVYNEMIHKGESEGEARKAAGKTFAANLPLNIVLDRWMFKELPGVNKLKSIIQGGQQEAAQEGLQTLISTIAKKEPVTTDEFSKEMLESMAIGGIVGGGIAGGKALTESIETEEVALIENVSEQQQEEVPNEYVPSLKDQGYTPEEIQSIENESEQNTVSVEKVVPGIKYADKPKIDPNINPINRLKKRVNEATDPELKNDLQDAVDASEDDVIPGVISHKMARKYAKNLDNSKIPYSYGRIDIENLGGANKKNGNVHAKTNEELKVLYGDIAQKEVEKYDGVLSRDKGDEFIVIMPNFTPNEASELFTKISQKMDAKRAELGLEETQHPKHNNMRTGALGMNFGFVESAPGKYGEMDRQSDEIANLMAKKRLFDKAQKQGYIYNEEADNYEPRKSSTTTLAGRESDATPAVGKDVSEQKPTGSQGVEGTSGKTEESEIAQNEQNKPDDTGIRDRDIPPTAGVSGSGTNTGGELSEVTGRKPVAKKPVSEDNEADKIVKSEKDEILSILRRSHKESLSDYFSKKDYSRQKYNSFFTPQKSDIKIDPYEAVGELLNTSDRTVIENAIFDAIDYYDSGQYKKTLKKGKKEFVPEPENEREYNDLIRRGYIPGLSYSKSQDIEKHVQDTANKVLKKYTPHLTDKVIVRSSDNIAGQRFNAGEDAAVIIQNGVANVVINKATKEDVKKLLLHEVVGHFGFNTLIKENKQIGNTLENLYASDRDSETMAKIRKLYKGQYEQMNSEYGTMAAERMLFNEWLAEKVTQHINKTESGKPKVIARRVYDSVAKLVRRILGRFGLADAITDDLIHETIERSLQAMKRRSGRLSKSDIKSAGKTVEQIPLYARNENQGDLFDRTYQEDMFSQEKPKSEKVKTGEQQEMFSGESEVKRDIEKFKREKSEKEAEEAKDEKDLPLFNDNEAERTKGSQQTILQKKTGKIEDFGEKIGGARKDVWSAFADKIEESKNVKIASSPLSESWPSPDYKSLLENGADKWSVAFIRAARDEIPAKPRRGYKLNRWVQLVESMREMSYGLINGETNKTKLKDELKKLSDTNLRNFGDILGRIELYEAVGHDNSLKNVRLRVSSYSMLDGVKYEPSKILWSVEEVSKGHSWPTQISRSETKEGAIKEFKSQYGEYFSKEKSKKEVQFNIYQNRGTKKYYIGKKIGRDVAKLSDYFDNLKDAREYKNTKQDELVKKLEDFKKVPNERRDSNRPRIGEDSRNGVDVTPELFSDTFGFRGVEFGNWVENAKRQKDLNDTYDALMDMSGILGISPKAISLNGELGIAFGARGSGGKNAAKAHYEGDYVVINLTKKDGAGSLAHEWWHALDNYFGRMAGKGVNLLTGFSPYYLSPNTISDVRPEMLNSFSRIVSAINSSKIYSRSKKLDKKRTKDYWSTGPEMSARAFETYIIEKLHDNNASNDYLANIMDEKTWKAVESIGFELEDSYPYPNESELDVVREVFGSFFDTIDEKNTEKGIALFSRSELSEDEQALERYDETNIIKRIEDNRRNRLDTTYDEAKKGNYKAKKPSRFKGVGTGLNRILTPITTRLKEIDESLKYQLRSFQYNVDTGKSKLRKTMNDFIEKKNEVMSEEDQKVFDLALKNRDIESIQKFIKKYDIAQEFIGARKALNSIWDEAEKVGFDVGYLHSYWPRRIINSEGFVNYMREKNPKYRSAIDEAIKTESEKRGRALTLEEQARIINTLIRGYRTSNVQLPTPANVKERSIDIIDNDLNVFYDSSDSSIMTYIDSMVESIEARRFFGKAATIENGMLDLDKSIGAFVMQLHEDGKLAPGKEEELAGILRARFNPGTVNRFVSMLRDLEYIDTMGSFFSAITQIQDLGFSMADAGVINTVKAMIQKNNVSVEDLGIDKIGAEFETMSRTSKALNKVFVATGLSAMDKFGKNVKIQASYNKYTQMSKKNPSRLSEELKPMFGDKTSDVVNDFKNGDITENVKYALFNDISDVQPISLSEMPEGYLRAGNGRIFYMLKTFQLKQMDVLRNTIMDGLKAKDKATRIRAAQKLLRMSGFLFAMGFASDAIKDWIAGRGFEPKDTSVDNALKLIGLSRYMTWQFRNEGPVIGMLRFVSPPAKAIEAAARDIKSLSSASEKGEDLNIKDLEIWSSIPLLGKLYFWRFGKGKEIVQKRAERYSPYSEKRRELNKAKKKYDALRLKSPEKAAKFKRDEKELFDLERKIKRDGNKIKVLKGRRKKAESSGNDKMIDSITEQILGIMESY